MELINPPLTLLQRIAGGVQVGAFVSLVVIMHRQVHALRRLGTFEDAAGWVMLCSSIAGKERCTGIVTPT